MPDEPATLDEIADAGPVVEGTTRVLIPKKGKLFAEDGTVRVAIIRPCVSRGRRIRGLPPIYTPKMLAENAGVFTDWHMFMDHLTEEMVEALMERQRSIRELGGRMTKSWWDADLRLKEDDENGYKPGGVVGTALPQPPIRAMLEADPELLHVSINAWPTAARVGEEWGQKGMVIEGLRPKPRGSVDWVLRGGAGGRPLVEDEQLAVSLLESYYDAAQGDHVSGFDIKTATVDQLREHIQAQAPALYTKLMEGAAPPPPATPPATPPAVPPTGALTEEAVQRLLETQATKLTTTFEEKLAEREGAAEKRATEIVRERESARAYETEAHRMIREAAGLTPSIRADLASKYSLRPDSIPQALQPAALMEGENVKTPALDVLREAVRVDIEHGLNLIAEAQGKPRVTGQGREKVKEGETPPAGAKRTNNAFREFMMEGGGFEKPDDVDRVLESVGG